MKPVNAVKIRTFSIIFVLVIGLLLGTINLIRTETLASTSISGSIATDTTWDLAGSPYYIEGDTTVDAGVTLTIDSGVTVKFNGHFSLYVDGNLKCEGTDIQKITITSNMSTPTNGDWKSIQVNSTGRADIRYSEISYGRYGVYLRTSQNNNLTNNIITNCSFFGIYMTSSRNNLVAQNILKNNRDGMAVQSSTLIDIMYNNITYNNGKGMDIRTSNNINILSNNISNNDEEGIYLFASESIVVTNNNLTTDGVLIDGNEVADFNTHTITTDNMVNQKPLYYHKDLTNLAVDGIDAGQLIVANCTKVLVGNLDIAETDVGIEMAYVSNADIAANTISTNIQDGIGIWVESSDKINISGNEISESRVGIRPFESRINIENNNISGNYYGMYPRNNDRMNITGNLFSYNDQYGIWFYDNTNTTIMGNDFKYNQEGMRIQFSSYATITENTFSHNNGWGIRILSGHNNSIYHNNFYKNLLDQAQDGGEDNTWDNGYPAGGNYWSDYPGLDEFSGPNQDQSDPDGIGDSPYSINGGAQDGYPLMWPFEYEYSTFIIPLSEGWNMISLPLIPVDDKIDEVLKDISSKWDNVQHYSSPGNWISKNIDKPETVNDLKTLDERIGFWIHVTESGVELTVQGYIPPSETIALNTGWNHVVWPSFASRNRTLGLNNLEFGTDVDVVQWYDASTGTWHFLGPDDDFVPGRGYWMHSKVDTTWEVPV